MADDQEKKYEATLKELQEKEDPEIDIVFDTTEDDVNWLRQGRKKRPKA